MKPSPPLVMLPVSEMKLTIAESDKPIWEVTSTPAPDRTDWKVYQAKANFDNLSLVVVEQWIETKSPRKKLDEIIQKSLKNNQLLETERRYKPDQGEEQDASEEPMLSCFAEYAQESQSVFFHGCIVASAKKPHLYRLYLCTALCNKLELRQKAEAFVNSFQPEFDPILLKFESTPQSADLLRTAELWVNDCLQGKASDLHEISVKEPFTVLSIALKNQDGTLYQKENVRLQAGQTYPGIPLTLTVPPVVGELTLLMTPPDTVASLEGEVIKKTEANSSTPFVYTYQVQEGNRPSLVLVTLHREGYLEKQIYLELSRGKRTVKLPPLSPISPPKMQPTSFTKTGDFTVTFPNTPQIVPDGFWCTDEANRVQYGLNHRPFSRQEREKSHQAFLNSLIVDSNAVRVPGSENLNEAAHVSSVIAAVIREAHSIFYCYFLVEDTLYTLKVEMQRKAELDNLTRLYFESFKPVSVPGQFAFLELRSGKYWLPEGLQIAEMQSKEILKIVSAEPNKPAKTTELMLRRNLRANAVGFYSLECRSYEIPASLSRLSEAEILNLCAASVNNQEVLLHPQITLLTREIEIKSLRPARSGFPLTVVHRRLLVNSLKNRLYVLSAETRADEGEPCAVRLFFNRFETN